MSQAIAVRSPRWIHNISEAELLRLKVLARLHARGLPGGIEWSDLLHEALVRVFEGKRRKPAGVDLVPFVAEVMRSIRSEHWRRAQREVQGVLDDRVAGGENPEQRVAAFQALVAIHRLFADDAPVRKIINGLGLGLSAEEIQQRDGMSPTDYDSARKRIRRKLLREGITWRAFHD